MTIAVDAMGGDHAPRVVVEGAVAAAVELGLETLLVGRRREIEAELRRLVYTGSRVGIVDADEVVELTSPRSRRSGRSAAPPSGSPPSASARDAPAGCSRPGTPARPWSSRR